MAIGHAQMQRQVKQSCGFWPGTEGVEEAGCDSMMAGADRAVRKGVISSRGFQRPHAFPPFTPSIPTLRQGCVLPGAHHVNVLRSPRRLRLIFFLPVFVTCAQPFCGIFSDTFA